MKTFFTLFGSALFLLCANLYAGGEKTREGETVCGWEFNESAEGWSAGNMTHPVIEDGVLNARFTGSDPLLISPKFSVTPRAGLYVEFRLKTVTRSKGELFYAADESGPYNGFSQARSVIWPLVPDGEWHTYRVFPDWGELENLIRIRLDFGVPDSSMFEKEGIELDYVRILDIGLDSLPLVETPRWSFGAGESDWCVLDSDVVQGEDGWLLRPADGKSVNAADETTSLMTAPRVASGYFRTKKFPAKWISVTMKNIGPNAAVSYIDSAGKGETIVPIELDDDSADWITYNIPIGKDVSEPEIIRITVTGGTGEEPAKISEVELRETPKGTPRFRLQEFGPTEAFNRAGDPIPASLRLLNIGGETAEDVRLVFPALPDGVTVKDAEPGEDGAVSISLGAAAFGEMIEHDFVLEASEPIDTSIECVVTASGGQEKRISFPLKVTPQLGLPKADYVPEPRPVKLQDPELEIGALYFPGWGTKAAWDRIRRSEPIRKPVLGWYDEGNPEVVDWQIKWALESGISFFLVDWYWNRGTISHEHWIQAFQKARYRKQFKWAMMWANHNGAGSHSEEDQAKAVQYWLDHYFNTPEYYTIDGKPVVMIWAPVGMDNDIRAIEKKERGVDLPAGEGVKKLLDLSRKMAVDAGYPGIYFIAMKWSEADTSPASIDWLAQAGFDMTSIYHYMERSPSDPESGNFTFDSIVASSPEWWRARNETGILPFLPNLSTGWDDRPWNNGLVISGRTPEKFKTLCAEMKQFLKESQIKRICIAPVNEWGEGSYIEPNKEFGFGMYEALRETFCVKPKEGWPSFYAPSDVGLGPYTLGAPDTETK